MEETHDDSITWDVDVGLLIKLVQNFPHIYDHGHKSFKNSALRENTWAKIAATLKVPVEDCLRVWKNVRDKYTRERRVILSHPSEAAHLSKWEFYDAMEFLNPFIKRRRTLSVRKKPTFYKVEIETKDSPKTSLSATNSKVWDPIGVKLSPESISIFQEDFEDGSGELEDGNTFEIETADSPTRVKQVVEHPNISIIRHQTSEEAFGAYIATRLMEFPPEIRQIKKAKLFKDLEEPEEVL